MLLELPKVKLEYLLSMPRPDQGCSETRSILVLGRIGDEVLLLSILAYWIMTRRTLRVLLP